MRKERRTASSAAEQRAVLLCPLESPLGELLLACSDRAVKGLWIGEQKYMGGPYGKEPWFLSGKQRIDTMDDREKAEYRRYCLEQDPVTAQAAKWLDRYFAGEGPSPGELPLEPEGTEFQQLIWELLCRIPYGETTTYGALGKEAARLLGREHMSAQAVGGAVGHNPISLIIPCHRVLGSDGSLTGYAGGIEIKEKLLALEGTLC